MERVCELSRCEWVDEQLERYPLERLLAIRGLQPTHLDLLRKAGLTNLRQVWECERLPLMGGTTDWVRDWLTEFIKDLELEYQQLRRAAERAA